MKRIRRLVTCLCLATTLSVSVPCLAEPGGASQGSDPAGTPKGQGASKLDLSRLQRMTAWSDRVMASPQTPIPLKAAMQTNGGTSGMSTAKKTWMIVGIVVGAAVVVAAVSNHGSGSGGGGY